MTDPAQERKQIADTLGSAVLQLAEGLNPVLVPPEGLALGYALKGARDAGAVAAPAGRISIPSEGKPACGPVRFGADPEIARIILTAMKFDPNIRSAAIIAHSERAESVLCDDLFLESASCDHRPERDSGPMDWGIASCCRNGVPTVIIRRGPGDGTTRIIISAERPADVLNNIIICSNRI